MKKCKECTDKNKFLDFKFDCVEKKTCFFSKYDYRLTEISFEYFNLKSSEEKLKNLSSKIEESCVETRQKIENLGHYKFPQSSNEFTTLLKQLNAAIFVETKIRWFGEFRKKDIYFDTDQNELKGSDPDKIKEQLEILYDDYLKNFDFDSANKKKFLRICAIFLETFFRIHPFPDGNGRVARLFLILMGLETKVFIFERFDSMHGQDDKDYIKSLRHAHKYYNHPDLKKRENAHLKLIKWLGSKLSDQSEFTGVEEPPNHSMVCF